MIDWTPQPIAFSVGPLAVHWYGIMYAIGLALTYVVVEREARRRGLDVGLMVNGFIVIAFAALVGGRLYHVIDQWDARYRNDLLAIVLPPYSGLGVYGGIATGFIVGILYIRWTRQPILGWVDAAAPGLLVMQGVARWGNFFNQELYGPPTNLPWGIAIQCANRTPAWACPADGGTTPIDAHFVPLFLYESISGLVGAVVLILLARRVRSLRPGDLVLLFFAWYGTRATSHEQLVAGRCPDGLDHLGRRRGRGACRARLAASARGGSGRRRVRGRVGRRVDAGRRPRQRRSGR